MSQNREEIARPETGNISNQSVIDENQLISEGLEGEIIGGEFQTTHFKEGKIRLSRNVENQTEDKKVIAKDLDLIGRDFSVSTILQEDPLQSKLDQERKIQKNS